MPKKSSKPRIKKPPFNEALELSDPRLKKYYEDSYDKSSTFEFLWDSALLENTRVAVFTSDDTGQRFLNKEIANCIYMAMEWPIPIVLAHELAHASSPNPGITVKNNVEDEKRSYAFQRIVRLELGFHGIEFPEHDWEINDDEEIEEIYYQHYSSIEMSPEVEEAEKN